MRFQGHLQAWHAERGFGSIAPEQGGALLFVHISAFAQDGPPPLEGERLSFEVVTRRDGCKQAVRVQRCDLGTTTSSWTAPPRTRLPRGALRTPGRSGRTLARVLVLGVLGLALLVGSESLLPQGRQPWAALTAVWQG